MMFQLMDALINSNQYDCRERTVYITKGVKIYNNF